MGASHTFRQTKTILVGKVEEQLIPSVTASATTIPLGTVAELLSAGSGATATITVSGGAIATAVIGAGGTGYAVGDQLLVEGGTGGVLQVATIGAPGVIATYTILVAGTGYSAGTDATDPLPTLSQDLPHEFVIQDILTSERITISGLSAATGAYSAHISVPSTGLVNSYSAPFASILTPGVQQVMTSSHFNCRLRNIAMTPKIEMDGESEKFATGDHRKDQSISGVRTGTITFQDKVAVNQFLGTGAEVDFTAVAGAITAVTAAPTSGHAGTGYNVGDLLTVAVGTDGIAKVKTVNPSTGAITAFETTPYMGGSGYTTGETSKASGFNRLRPEMMSRSRSRYATSKAARLQRGWPTRSAGAAATEVSAVTVLASLTCSREISKAITWAVRT
jgi:hypothetical protein